MTIAPFDPLSRVTAYQLALDSLREGRADARTLAFEPDTRDVAPQLLRALGSISANIAEGYSRSGRPDRRRFLEYALGSTREAIVWYEATTLPDSASRIDRLVQIRRLLLTMIRTSREESKSAPPDLR